MKNKNNQNKSTNLIKSFFVPTKMIFFARAGKKPSGAAKKSPGAPAKAPSAKTEVQKKYDKLKKRADKLMGAINESSQITDRIFLLHSLGIINDDALSNGQLYVSRKNSGFNRTIDGKPLKTGLNRETEDSMSHIWSWCTQLKELKPGKKTLDYMARDWVERAKTIRKTIHESVKKSLKVQSYYSSHGFRQIQNKLLEELDRYYPGFRGVYNPSGEKLDTVKSNKLTQWLKKKLKQHFDISNLGMLPYLPALKNGQIDLNKVINIQEIKYIFDDFIKEGGEYLEKFKIKKPHEKPSFLIPGSPHWNDAEYKNTGKIEDISHLDVPDVMAPGMNESLENLEKNNFFFHINPPLAENAYFKAGVYAEFSVKGLCYHDNKPFSQPGVTPNKEGATEYTMTGNAKKGGSYIIPLPSGFAVSEIKSPRGAKLTKNSNGIYKITFSGEAAQIRLKIFETKDELKNKPTDADKKDFLGRFKGKPELGNIDINTNKPAQVLTLAKKIKAYIQGNTLYDTDSPLAKRAMKYYQSQPHFFAALEYRKFAQISGKEMMLADSGISNMYFVGLCRSAGIPARMITGYSAKQKVGFSPMQAWAEIWDGEKWVQINASPVRKIDDIWRNRSTSQSFAPLLAERGEEEGLEEPEEEGLKKVKTLEIPIKHVEGIVESYLEKYNVLRPDPELVNDFKDLMGIDENGNRFEPNMSLREFMDRNSSEYVLDQILRSDVEFDDVMKMFLDKFREEPDVGNKALRRITNLAESWLDSEDITDEESTKLRYLLNLIKGKEPGEINRLD